MMIDGPVIDPRVSTFRSGCEPERTKPGAPAEPERRDAPELKRGGGVTEERPAPRWGVVEKEPEETSGEAASVMIF